MESLAAELKGTPLAQDAREIFYPGELEGLSEERGRRDGVLLPPDTLADLTKLADEVNLRDRLPF